MNLAALVLAARLAAFRDFAPADVPTEAVVLAIIQHESEGRPTACMNEADGSSSRGLMMRRRPSSRCGGADDERFAGDFDPARAVNYGVWLLAYQARWCREHGHRGCDSLEHYAGRVPLARRFAREVREMARKLEEASP